MNAILSLPQSVRFNKCKQFLFLEHIFIDGLLPNRIMPREGNKIQTNKQDSFRPCNYRKKIKLGDKIERQ